MSFAEDTGYLPSTIAQLMNIVRVNVNTQFGTEYDEETFLGTNFYKYFYALIQRLQENEVKTSEIFLRMQEYFEITNEEIRRPNTTNPGLVDYFADAGYLISVKKPIEADAGKCYICVDVDETADDYADTKLALCTMIKDSVVAGVVTMGTESEAITLPNAQSFDFKYALPNRIPVQLKLTITLSDNNESTILSTAEITELLFANVNARYRLGRNFEPQRYFSIVDAPWAADVLLEWSDDAGANWHDEVYVAEYDDLFTFELGDIEVVEV